MGMPRLRSLALATVALGLAARPVAADAAGDKVLTSVDTAISRFKTVAAEATATVTETGKPERKLGLKSWWKGEKRLIEYVAPADVKGTKVLILSYDEMYVFLPAFGKVRRIASHTTDQGFLGMSFSTSDLASQPYATSYSAVVTTDGAKEWVITLTPKAGKTPRWAKIVMTVAKDKAVPTELEYFNADGKHVRTETRSGYTCEATFCGPATIKMADLSTGASTTLTRTSWKVNGEIKDDVFSKRSLAQ